MVKRKIVDNTKNSPMYRDALSALRANEGAKQLLGEPIEDKGIFRPIFIECALDRLKIAKCKKWFWGKFLEFLIENTFGFDGITRF